MKMNLGKAFFQAIMMTVLPAALRQTPFQVLGFRVIKSHPAFASIKKIQMPIDKKQIREGENMQLKNQREKKKPPLKTKTFCTRNRLKTERKLAFRNEKAYSLLMLNTTPAEMEAAFIFDSSINIKDKPRAFRKYGCSTKAHVMRDILLLMLTWKTSCMTEPLFSGVTVLPGYSAY